MSRLDEIRARLEAAKWLNPPEQKVETEGHPGCRHVRIDLGEDEYCVTVDEESTGEFIVHAKSDIEYLLKHIDLLEDSVVVYKLERPATDGVKDDMISKIADRAVNVSPEGAADFIRTGTSRHDWFGEAE